VLNILNEEGLVSGRTVSMDATTLEANAALKSIVRRDNGQSYTDYLKELAQAAGMENPTREQLARLDRKRKKKVTLQPANEGDTTTIDQTLAEAQTVAREINQRGVEEVVADKGYHSGAVLQDLHTQEVRSYIPEPERGRRNWQGEGKAEEQKRTYENRRRVRGDRNKRLQKLRSELTERSFAHLYETGGMRRVHLQGRKNILKRLLVQGAGFNLSLILRKMMGVGKPRRLQGLCLQLFTLLRRTFFAVWEALETVGMPVATLRCKVQPFRKPTSADSFLSRLLKNLTSATGC
jgi:transposase